MNEEKTIVEDNDKTITENFIKNSREESSVLKNFKEYTIDKQIEASGESDIYTLYIKTLNPLYLSFIVWV